MNLVMIGRFKEARAAEEARHLIEQLIALVTAEEEGPGYRSPPQDRSFSDTVRTFLYAARLYNFAPEEIDQFRYDVSVGGTGNEVVLKTDESEISAFLKVLIETGGRIDVYSAHDYPESEPEATADA